MTTINAQFFAIQKHITKLDWNSCKKGEAKKFRGKGTRILNRFRKRDGEVIEIIKCLQYTKKQHIPHFIQTEKCIVKNKTQNFEWYALFRFLYAFECAIYRLYLVLYFPHLLSLSISVYTPLLLCLTLHIFLQSPPFFSSLAVFKVKKIEFSKIQEVLRKSLQKTTRRDGARRPREGKYSPETIGQL